ncbi:MAG: guaA, partial [Blastococcus sp.]|nr:guaA [Blastococcus sp.]
MDFPTVLVVDFGAQYAQLIARRIREAGVYSEIVPSSVPAEEVLARKPAAIVLSGGPSSVYAPGAPQIDAALFEAGVPAFGICYGFQAMAQSLGGSVAHTGDREYGGTPLTVTTQGRLFGTLPVEQNVWMSHGDAVSKAPPGFTVTATSTGAPVAAFEDVDRKLAGVQFHPEVRHTAHGQTVLVVDFGAQYAQLIARRVREAGVYSEIVPGDLPVAEVLARKPAAIILSGGPSSVYAEGAPQVDPTLFESGVPAFGICYGFQAMAASLGGTVARTGDREYGGTPLTVTTPGSLFGALPSEQSVWMSHGDAVSAAPPGFTVTATSTGAPVAAFEDLDRRLAGVQFHPEVRHTAHGQTLLEHFLFDIAGLEPSWTMANVVEEQVAAIREQIGNRRALCALSGGVDSAVAAALVQRAIGDKLTCVYVDHG